MANLGKNHFNNASTVMLGFWLLFFSTPLQASSLRQLHVDLEVALCPEGQLSLTELERPFLANDTDAFESNHESNYQQHYTSNYQLNQLPDSDYHFEFEYDLDLIKNLDPFSPARSRMLQKFKNQYWSHLKPLKQSTLRPRTESTAIISRRDCEFKILAHISVNQRGDFSGFIDADLFEPLPKKTKHLLIAESYFYFESMYWTMNINSRPPNSRYWDPTRARYFLNQWLSPSHRPKDLPTFNRLVLTSNLNFIEQSGVLIPLIGTRPLEWNRDTGLVLTSYNHYKTNLWTTYLQFPQQDLTTSIPYSGWTANGPNSRITFHKDGQLHCLPFYKKPNSTFTRAQIGPTEELFIDEWSSPPYSHDSKNLCVYPNGNVESGYLNVNWNETRTWMYKDSIMTITRDPLAGGSDQGTWITFFPNGSIHTIDDSEGVIVLQNKKVKVKGPMRFDLVQDSQSEKTRLKCASLPVGSRWLDSLGRELVVSSMAQTFCFDQNERITNYCTRPFCAHILKTKGNFLQE